MPRRQVELPDQLMRSGVAEIRESTTATGNSFWNEYIRLQDSGENVDVQAIGDSWLHYPFNNLMTPLHAALEASRSS